MARKIALVGIGKIARDQPIPVINRNPDWELAATVSRNASVEGIENFSAIEQLLEAALTLILFRWPCLQDRASAMHSRPCRPVVMSCWRNLLA